MSAMIYSLFPDREAARYATKALLDEGLIACANILGEVESHFVWAGEQDITHEVGTLFKTDQQLLGRAVERLGELHPYDTPAILGWRCDAPHPATADWLGAIVVGR